MAACRFRYGPSRPLVFGVVGSLCQNPQAGRVAEDQGQEEGADSFGRTGREVPLVCSGRSVGYPNSLSQAWHLLVLCGWKGLTSFLLTLDEVLEKTS